MEARKYFCPSNYTILIVEDDQEVAESLLVLIKKEGYNVLHVPTAEKAILVLNSSIVHLAILDWMLPDMEGIELCKLIRRSNPLLPIIFLTVRDTLSDRIRALEEGADDFFTKPLLSFRELAIKIRNLLIRSYGENAIRIIKLGDVIIDISRRILTKPGGHTVTLSRTETRLLQFLYAKRNNILTREEIYSTVWGSIYPVHSRTLDNYIHRLRELIEPDPSNPTFILTEKNRGYMLRVKEEMPLPHQPHEPN